MLTDWVAIIMHGSIIAQTCRTADVIIIADIAGRHFVDCFRRQVDWIGSGEQGRI